jgi:hypothetical protein
MDVKTATDELEQFATGLEPTRLTVKRAAIALDERQDGEPVTRAVLLVTEPEGDTWDVGAVRELRFALGKKATELGLPPISLTLVPEGEAELVEAFSD